jgi:hypothetical protein
MTSSRKPSKPKVWQVKMPTGQVIDIVEYSDGSFELACMVCDEPLLIGPDDYFNLVEDEDGTPVAFLCVPCAKKAMERLKK